MDYKKRSMLLRRATNVRWSVLGGEDEPELTNIHDITQTQDDSDAENFLSQVLVGALLENILFRLLIMVVVVSNCLIIALQTNSVIAKQYDIPFSVFEQIILTVFVWEILVKWYYGFNIFWKNAWNILDCCVTTALIMAPLLFPDDDTSVLKIIRVIRVIRSVRGFASMQGVSMMVQVIVQSIPDMANIFLLLIIIMLIFAVFGVTLFSAAVPSAFGDLSYALYTLFICITQDGWMAIYREFDDGEEGLKYGASLYFFVFLTGGAFIFANLLVAVVTTNLEICMADRDEKNNDTMTSVSL
ncbi:cation channel sperm-associated protein 4-like [Aplochiton taeniatus]